MLAVELIRRPQNCAGVAERDDEVNTLSGLFTAVDELICFVYSWELFDDPALKVDANFFET